MNNPLSRTDPTGFSDIQEQAARDAVSSFGSSSGFTELSLSQLASFNIVDVNFLNINMAMDSFMSLQGLFLDSFQAEVEKERASEKPSLLGTAGNIVGKIWSLPNTIVGLAFGTAGYVLGNIAYAIGLLESRPTWSIGNNAIQFENNPLSIFGALTTGNTINYGGGTNPDEDGPHEYPHTIQGQILGPLYLPLHIIFQTASVLTYPIANLRGPSPVHGKANLLETGPLSDSHRPWPW